MRLNFPRHHQLGWGFSFVPMRDGSGQMSDAIVHARSGGAVETGMAAMPPTRPLTCRNEP